LSDDADTSHPFPPTVYNLPTSTSFTNANHLTPITPSHSAGQGQGEMFQMDIGDIMDQIFGGEGGAVGRGGPGQYHRHRKPPTFKPKGTSARLYRRDHYLHLVSSLTYSHAHMHTHIRPYRCELRGDSTGAVHGLCQAASNQVCICHNT
jgi:hypothetical protein